MVGEPIAHTQGLTCTKFSLGMSNKINTSIFFHFCPVLAPSPPALSHKDCGELKVLFKFGFLEKMFLFQNWVESNFLSRLVYSQPHTTPLCPLHSIAIQPCSQKVEIFRWFIIIREAAPSYPQTSGPFHGPLLAFLWGACNRRWGWLRGAEIPARRETSQFSVRSGSDSRLSPHLPSFCKSSCVQTSAPD